MMLGSGSVIRRERGGECWYNELILSDFRQSGDVGKTNYRRLFVTIVCRLDWNHDGRWGTGFFRYWQELVVQ